VPWVRASSKLLFALLSHSLGSSGGYHSGTIDFLAFSQCRSDHQAVRVFVAIELFWSDQHDINRLSNSMEIEVNIPYHLALVELPTFHHEKIDITMRSHRFPRGGSEKNDSLRVCYSDNTLNNLLKYCLSDLSHSCHLTASLTLNIVGNEKSLPNFLSIL